MGFDEEQREIIHFSDKLDNSKPGRKWFRYKGDAIARKVIAMLSNHLTNWNVVGPNVYLDEDPLEVDALIVEKASLPIEGAAYKKKDVKVLIEIKENGFVRFSKKEQINNYFERFRATGKPFVYLTIRENGTLTNLTKAVLANDSFFLSELPHHVVRGQWQMFVEHVRDLAIAA